jgi:ectoine hydroxylase-related dioxygenase (phytanoyl-CoA dioxygenase family)
MLLFSPALDHSVETNRSNALRLSIAFNIGPET